MISAMKKMKLGRGKGNSSPWRLEVAVLHRISMHDPLGKSRLSRELDKIRKPSMQRLWEQMAPARETSRGKCLKEQGSQEG